MPLEPGVQIQRRFSIQAPPSRPASADHARYRVVAHDRRLSVRAGDGDDATASVRFKRRHIEEVHTRRG